MMCCRNGEYIIEHDGKIWKPDELKSHIKQNNHQHVHISWAAPDITKYLEMQIIAHDMETNFVNNYSRNSRNRRGNSK